MFYNYVVCAWRCQLACHRGVVFIATAAAAAAAAAAADADADWQVGGFMSTRKRAAVFNKGT